MSGSEELRTRLAAAHGAMGALLSEEPEARLRGTLVPDRWNVLDVIAHNNSWGWIFLGDARYMARHPGRPIPYRLYTTSRFDDENEALVLRRRGWTVAQYAEENRGLSEALGAFLDEFGGELPDLPVVQSWGAEALGAAGALAYHARHSEEHLRDIRAALGKV
jgi:hypothetical protein